MPITILKKVPVLAWRYNVANLDARYLLKASNLSDLASASTARTNLGVAIGSNVQAWDTQLDDLAGLAVTKGNVIIADGSNWLALGVGSNDDVLTAASGEASGVKWAAPAGGGSNWSVASNLMQPAVDGDGVLIDVPTTNREALVLQTTDDNTTKNLLEGRASSGNVLWQFDATGRLIPDLNTDPSNTFIGTGAGIGTASGTGNTAAGELSGSSLTTANQNVLYGAYSGRDITEGLANTIVGFQAGLALTTGNTNMFLGNQAGKATTTASNNVFIGSAAGLKNTTGYNNLFLGTTAGNDNTEGYNNVGMGYGALANIITGRSCVAVGSSALEFNTANFNVGIGWSAGKFNVTGTSNVLIGYQAAFGVSANSHANGVIIGYKAGYAITTGSNNILLGYQAGDVITSGDDNIIIGYNIDPSGATVSDELNIGGLIKGYLAAHGSGPAINLMGGTPQAQQAHIVDADGNLADITTKFNTLLADLEGFGLLAAA